MEMDELMGKKKNVHPELLLTNEKVHIPERQSEALDKEPEEILQTENEENTEIETPRRRKKRQVNKRKLCAEMIRQDKRKYYEERLNLEKEKIEVLKKRNELLEERNHILEKINCRNCVTHY